MKNLTLENITKACCGTYHGDPSKLDKEVANVVIDSRKVEKDFLFVAIDGERVNAHKFIPDTIEKGALCVVSHEDLGETDIWETELARVYQYLRQAPDTRTLFDDSIFGAGVWGFLEENKG